MTFVVPPAPPVAPLPEEWSLPDVPQAPSASSAEKAHVAKGAAVMRRTCMSLLARNMPLHLPFANRATSRGRTLCSSPLRAAARSEVDVRLVVSAVWLRELRRPAIGKLPREIAWGRVARRALSARFRGSSARFRLLWLQPRRREFRLLHPGSYSRCQIRHPQGFTSASLVSGT